MSTSCGQFFGSGRVARLSTDCPPTSHKFPRSHSPDAIFHNLEHRARFVTTRGWCAPHGATPAREGGPGRPPGIRGAIAALQRVVGAFGELLTVVSTRIPGRTCAIGAGTRKRLARRELRSRANQKRGEARRAGQTGLAAAATAPARLWRGRGRDFSVLTAVGAPWGTLTR